MGLFGAVRASGPRPPWGALLSWRRAVTVVLERGVRVGLGVAAGAWQPRSLPLALRVSLPWMCVGDTVDCDVHAE